MKKEPELDRYFYMVGCFFIAAFFVIMGCVVLFGEQFLDLVPHCFFHRITGYYCPGCGGTRATSALLHGHFLQSLYFHPFVGYAQNNCRDNRYHREDKKRCQKGSNHKVACTLIADSS